MKFQLGTPDPEVKQLYFLELFPVYACDSAFTMKTKG